jgi:hypothetical protein
MTQSIDNSLEILDGLSLVGKAGLFAGDDDPWTEITNAPKGSIYLKTSGVAYIKIGVGNTSSDWSQLPSTSDVSTLSKQVTFIFSKISVGNNQWLRIGEVSSSSAAGAVPFATTLKEISVAYTSLSSAKDLKIVKNGTTVQTITVPASASAASYVVSGLSVPLASGDRIQVQGGASGGSIADCVVYLAMRG